MPEVNDWNAKIIEEFRANGGRSGGQFEGAPCSCSPPRAPRRARPG